MVDLTSLAEHALEILALDGEIVDTLGEFRRTWGKEVPILYDQRFDQVALQYLTFPHEEGVLALGQELTACGYSLYDFDDEDEYLFILIAEAEKDALEAQCRQEGHYFKLMKQPRRKWGQPAKEQDPGKRMPCQERLLVFSEGEQYHLRGIAGDYAYGRWKMQDVDEGAPGDWQGSFVIDLRQATLTPVKIKVRQLSSLLYHRELDLYAAIWCSSGGSMWMVGWGKDPAKMADWARPPKSLKSEETLYWLGNTLCCGGQLGGFCVTLNERGMEKFDPIGAGEKETSWHFTADGTGQIYLLRENRGNQEKEVLAVKNDLERVFAVHGYDRLENSIPLPGTDKLITIHEAWSGYGESRGHLLKVDMKTHECSLATLSTMGETLNIRHFWQDWVLISTVNEDRRKDYAQLWNQQTNEILRIRPQMFGLDNLKDIAVLRDGTVVIWTLRRGVGYVLCYPKDFWGFIRAANKPKKLSAWCNYPNRYPEITNQVPPLNSEQVFAVQPDSLKICGKQLFPPFKVEDVTAILGPARVVVRDGISGAAPVADHAQAEILYIWDDLSLMGWLDEHSGCLRTFFLCLKPHLRVLTERPFNGAVLVDGKVYNDVDTPWEICGLLDQIQVGDFCVTTCLESRGIQRELMWYYQRHLQISYCPEGQDWSYALSPPAEPVLKFQNLNFKLAVMQVLMYEKHLLEPEFDICHFAAQYPRRRIDLEYEGHALPITEALLWFKAYPIPARLASEVTAINMDPSAAIYQNLAPNWDSNDELFNIDDDLSEEEVQQFPNLQHVCLLSSKQQKIKAVFEKCGVEVTFTSQMNRLYTVE